MKTFSLTGAAWSAEFWGAACAAGFCGGEDSVGFVGVDFCPEPGAAGASGSCCAVANAPAISRTHAPRTKKTSGDDCMMKLNGSISPARPQGCDRAAAGVTLLTSRLEGARLQARRKAVEVAGFIGSCKRNVLLPGGSAGLQPGEAGRRCKWL